jgi:hypothetical protein
MFHVFPILMPWADASARVYHAVGAFVRRRLEGEGREGAGGRGSSARAGAARSPSASQGSHIDATTERALPRRSAFSSTVKEIVVTGPTSPPIATLDDLAGKTVFVRRAGSSPRRCL